jgi:hypothetical protein
MAMGASDTRGAFTRAPGVTESPATSNSSISGG